MNIIADKATQAEKSAAFEWLRGVALDPKLIGPSASRLAAIALDEWHACRTAVSATRRSGDITEIDDDETADNEGVDRLAAAMKAKLKAKRFEGRGGWHNDCTIARLRSMYLDHIGKGDVLDVANFVMMIWNRENPNNSPDGSTQT